MTVFDLPALGWDDRWAAEFAPLRDEGLVPARIGRVDRGGCEALTAQGPVRATVAGELLVALAADPQAGPCTGDWVALRGWPDGPTTLAAVLDRRSALVRAAASGRAHAQVLAANVDTVLVVDALDDEPDLGRIERFVTLTWESGAAPVVTLTKSDLAAGQHVDIDAVAAEVAAVAPGVPVLVVSARTGAGLDGLASRLGAGSTVALLGRSGVGKSTLVNALVGAHVLGAAGVRADGKGRHTTTRRELVPLPGGGVLIDTPGLRGVALWDAGEALERTFTDIEELAASCRFSDCAHAGEPGCAVLAAIEDGTLAQRRLDSYRKLVREARWIAGRADARLRAQRLREWKITQRAARQHQRDR